ncbi:TetR family transcriptional regulator C-terminal domain-containing protein [Saccharothrix sp. S26]|uniref:TetR/AcrR family transcriptional regulator n=1 Tax=Saccharothrix sp. S26 TaxID=2907215 RepID=UPI001F3D13B8|nr:TetR family transcriptional regulator C-terminal domain-containing protein [Saccharothrix sp. S26]MCE6994026.1 TetR family transcriptional regulator C-terminal domain-containing protein [Saccharothrix sp. S26]
MPKVVDPEARRREVAEAVFRVVRRHGLDQASLRNVAAEAGLAIGSVRHYFADHDELLRFALEELTDRLERRVLAHVARARSATTRDERVRAVEDLLGELLPLDPDRRDESEIWLAFTTAARTRSTLRPAARRLHEGMRVLVGKVLAESGVPDAGVETERLTSLLDGLAVNGVLHPDLTTPDVMRAVLRRHLASLVDG